MFDTIFQKDTSSDAIIASLQLEYKLQNTPASDATIASLLVKCGFQENIQNSTLKTSHLSDII